MTDLRGDIEHSLEEAVYLVVGLTLLGLQRARVRSRELSEAAPLERIAGLAAAFAEPVVGPAREVFDRIRRAVESPR